MLPDELEHEQLVKICIEQRTRNRIELPIMVVRPPGDINDHNKTNLLHRAERTQGFAMGISSVPALRRPQS